MSFKQRLSDWERPLVMYEVIPPPKSAPQEEVADAATFIKLLVSDHQLDAINVPDVRNESRNGARQAGFMHKLEPRQFAVTLADIFGSSVDLIVNHCVVYEPPGEQRDWFATTFTKFNIPNVVLVGGESSEIKYPGPSVLEAAEIARDAGRQHSVTPSIGAITIPSRRGGRVDEPDRMLAKVQNGIGFFTSQVIFEAETSRLLLRDYDAACKAARVEPAPVFLSFAPIAGRKDAEFLEWLGVDIPQTSKDWILAPHANVLDRSARVAEHLLRDILNYVDRHKLAVPVGVNVEHIMKYNFEASEVLLDRLTSLVEWQELERRARA